MDNSDKTPRLDVKRDQFGQQLIKIIHQQKPVFDWSASLSKNCWLKKLDSNRSTVKLLQRVDKNNYFFQNVYKAILLCIFANVPDQSILAVLLWERPCHSVLPGKRLNVYP